MRAQAYHRAAQAASALQDHEQALALLDRGLQQVPGAQELQSLRQVTHFCWATLTFFSWPPVLTRWCVQSVLKKQRAEHAAQQERAAQQLAARAPAKKLALQLLAKGWRIGRPQMSVGAPNLCTDQALFVLDSHWCLCRSGAAGVVGAASVYCEQGPFVLHSRWCVRQMTAAGVAPHPASCPISTLPCL